MQSQKQQNDLCSFPRQAEVEWFYEDLQDLLELTHTHTHTQNKKQNKTKQKTDVLFIIGN